MAIDQRDVSSKLRFMDDRALQQYAAMHKNDPYIFPLAFQESQNRQKLRMSQQAQAGAQPQPKVADQALAQMAPQPMPEDLGIATLPAPNMKFGAEGGIMGYEGYGEEPQQFSQEPVLRMAEGGVARYNGETGSVTNSRSQFVQDFMAIPQMYTDYQQRIREEDALKAEKERLMEQRKQEYLAARQKTSFANYLFGSPETEAKGQDELAKLSSSAPATYDPAANLKKLAKTDKYVSTSTPNNAEEARLLNRYPTTKPAAKKDDAAPKADTTRRNKPAPSAAATDTSAKPTTGGLDSLVTKLTSDTERAQESLRKQRAGLASQLEDEAKGAKEEGEKSRAERGDVFKGREDRLAAREKGVEGMGDKYMGLALLQAGAAMMSTPGNLGSVIGKGIQVGSERYIAGIDKINAAKDKFAEARDRLEDLRINRDDMNAKEVREENRAIRGARIQGQQLMVEGATKDLEMTNANFREFFKAGAEDLKTDKTIAADLKNTMIREGGANARAAMPTGADRTAMLLGTGKTEAERLESGMKKMQELTADKSGMAAVKLLTEANAKLMPGEPRLTMEDLLKSAREYSSLMYGPKVADVATTRARP